MRQFDSEKIGSALKTFQMLRPAKWLLISDQQRFKQAVTVKKTSIKNRNHRLLFRNEPAIEKNDHAKALMEKKAAINASANSFALVLVHLISRSSFPGSFGNG